MDATAAILTDGATPTATETPLTSGQQTATTRPADELGEVTNTHDSASENQKTAPADKSFSQDEVNRLLAREKRDWEKRLETARLAADAQLNELRGELSQRQIRDSITEQAAAAGVKNVKLFLAAYGSQIKSDSGDAADSAVLSGKIESVIAAARAEAPELFSRTPNGQIDGGEGREVIRRPALTREIVDKMSPAEINRRWDEVSKFLIS